MKWKLPSEINAEKYKQKAKDIGWINEWEQNMYVERQQNRSNKIDLIEALEFLDGLIDRVKIDNGRTPPSAHQLIIAEAFLNRFK